MKTLFNLDIKDYENEWPHSKRPSARGIIILDENNNQIEHSENKKYSEDDKIVLVHSKKFNYYKFPGGGIKERETEKEALIREVQEEIGLTVIPESIQEYGLCKRLQCTNIFANTIFEQDSFYYFCKVQSSNESDLIISEQNLDPYEAEAGFEISIVSIKDAIKANQTSLDEDSFSIVMVERDTRILNLLIEQEPFPSKNFAKFILEQSVKMNPGPWENHSKNVAECAEKVARHILKNNNAINEDGTINYSIAAEKNLMIPEKAYILGLLHDIGRRNGISYLKHVYDGYIYMKELGYDLPAQICLTHSFDFPEISCYIGEHDLEQPKIDFILNELKKTKYTDYDLLIQLLDATCGADGTKNLEIRMNDVKKRYGKYPFTKWARNFELKAYFEELLAEPLYSVIE